MSTRSKKLPSIGSLVTLHPYSDTMNYVKVEQTGGGTLPLEDGQLETREFPIGTVAMVIGHMDHPDDKTGDTTVPLIIVDGFKGWIFNDEWKYLTGSRRKRAI